MTSALNTHPILLCIKERTVKSLHPVDGEITLYHTNVLLL